MERTAAVTSWSAGHEIVVDPPLPRDHGRLRRFRGLCEALRHADDLAVGIANELLTVFQESPCSIQRVLGTIGQWDDLAIDTPHQLLDVGKYCSAGRRSAPHIVKHSSHLTIHLAHKVLHVDHRFAHGAHRREYFGGIHQAIGALDGLHDIREELVQG